MVGDSRTALRASSLRCEIDWKRINKQCNLSCVLVTLKNGEPGSADRFFVLPWRKLRAIVVRGYRRYLAKHGNVRPRSPESFHTKVDISDVVAFEQRWELICGRARSIPRSNINR